MTRLAAVVAIGGVLCGAATTVTGQEGAPAVPSGIVLSLQDVLIEEDAHLARFRYVAPDLDRFGFAGVENDFPDLCAKQAVPWVREGHDAIRRVVISMASAPVEFGVASPDVTQFFEMFRIEDSACIWEGL